MENCLAGRRSYQVSLREVFSALICTIFIKDLDIAATSIKILTEFANDTMVGPRGEGESSAGVL
jgi:hypothetical protein